MLWLEWQDGEGDPQARLYVADNVGVDYLGKDADARAAWRAVQLPPDPAWTLEEPASLAAFEAARTAIQAGTATDAQVQTYLAYLGP
jgi:hypothetical protein